MALDTEKAIDLVIEMLNDTELYVKHIKQVEQTNHVFNQLSDIFDKLSIEAKALSKEVASYSSLEDVPRVKTAQHMVFMGFLIRHITKMLTYLEGFGYAKQSILMNEAIHYVLKKRKEEKAVDKI